MFCSALGAGALFAEAALLSQHLHPKEVVQESCSSGAVWGAALGTLEFFWHKTSPDAGLCILCPSQHTQEFTGFGSWYFSYAVFVCLVIISLLKAHPTPLCLSDVKRESSILVFQYFCFFFFPPVVSDLLFSVGKYQKGFCRGCAESCSVFRWVNVPVFTGSHRARLFRKTVSFSVPERDITINGL